MRALRFVAIVFAVVFPASVGLGQNLLINPNFHTDVAGWTASSESALAWDPLDAEASPASGSAVVTCLGEEPNDSNGTFQCVGGITGESYFLFAADMLIPSGQSETGHAHLLVQWYSESGCTGFLGLADTSGFPSTTPDVWLTDFGIAEAPAGAQFARLRLSVSKNEGVGSLDAHFDNVVLEAALLVDGFESGDTSAWSTTVP